ncbi:hypothetical protein BGW38_007362, partial [Lunasporangiospora selenospora]
IMTKHMPVSSILRESAKGASYFLGIENGIPNGKDYVIFRRNDAILKPYIVAQEWNAFIRSLKICDSAHWRSQVANSGSLTKRMVSKWAMEKQDEARGAIEGSSVTAATSQATTPIQQSKRIMPDATELSQEETVSSTSGTTSNSSCKTTISSSRSTTSGQRSKKRSFQVYLKEPEVVLEHTLEGDITGLRLGIKYFRDRFSELVVPDRDVSKCLPEALSINGILWIDQMPTPRPKECSSCLKELREFFPPPRNVELQSLSLKVQAIIQSDVCVTKEIHAEHETRRNGIYTIQTPVFSGHHFLGVVGLIGEVKPPEMDRYENFKCHDFWKLIQMGKTEINEQIIKGIQSPRIMCVQVFGYEVVMYVMKMDQAGVYILYKAAEGYLPRSTSDIPGTENIISIFQHSKTILQEFQKELDTTVPHTDGSSDEPSLK